MRVSVTIFLTLTVVMLATAVVVGLTNH